MTNELFKELATKCLDGTATPAEQEAFNKAYQLLSHRHVDWQPELMGDEKTVKLDIYRSLTAGVNKSSKKRTINRVYKYAVAAAVLMFLGFRGYLLLHEKLPLQQVTQNLKSYIPPGANRATLTLANGQKMVLTKNMSGRLSSQGTANIQMATGGVVTYTHSKKGSIISLPTIYNTLTTKKGEQFSLVLADGTEVMLDAASSITFPVSFSGKERSVKLTGQAYFKVVHNAHRPFLVAVKGQTITDIGTEFNINAYDDESAVKTTLLNGSVKVSKANESVVLIPGQQSQISDNSNKITVVKNADMQIATAWKNGFFQYNNADIQTVMRQVARWYDVDIQYEGNISKREFSGKMQRNLNASQVLELLSFTKIHFRIEGKKIIVTP